MGAKAHYRYRKQRILTTQKDGFKSMSKNAVTRQDILQYADEVYGTTAEYLWANTPTAAVLRHRTNRKWYAILMEVPKVRLGLSGDGAVDVLNVKCDPLLIGSLLKSQGFLPAYHMSKAHWISILLDGSLSAEDVFPLVDLSFQMTEKKIKK